MRVFLMLVICGTFAGCGGSPVAPGTTGAAGVAGAASVAPSLNMPIAVADSAAAAYGIWPFGVHGGGHASDGHPGWDIEFKPGAALLAPADGTIFSVVPDPNSAILFTIALDHEDRRYRTYYTNLASVAPGIAAGAAVRQGQVLGIPATVSQFIGPRQVSWAMTHFQFDDFTQSVGITNPSATNPEPFLSPSGRAVFDAIWKAAAYNGELCEPFAGNSRTSVFPLTRTWTRESGGLAARIDFTRETNTTNDYLYVMRDLDGNDLERGTAQVDPAAPAGATIDFRPSSGPIRLGTWDILSDTMRLDYAAPGAARPAGLAAAAVYKTKP